MFERDSFIYAFKIITKTISMPGFEKIEVGIKDNVHGKISLQTDVAFPTPKIEIQRR